MSYDRYLARNTAELLRFAEIFADDRTPAACLVEQSVRRTRQDLGCHGTPEQWAKALRVWVVRACLSEGMRLGGGVAADVDSPLDGALALGSPSAPADPCDDDLAARFATSSRLQRCVSVLHWREHHNEAETAEILGSTAEGIARYLDQVRDRLAVGPGRAHCEQDVRRLLHLWVAATPDAVSKAVADAAVLELVRPTLIDLPRPDRTAGRISAIDLLPRRRELQPPDGPMAGTDDEVADHDLTEAHEQFVAHAAGSPADPAELADLDPIEVQAALDALAFIEAGAIEAGAIEAGAIQAAAPIEAAAIDEIDDELTETDDEPLETYELATLDEIDSDINIDLDGDLDSDLDDDSDDDSDDDELSAVESDEGEILAPDETVVRVKAPPPYPSMRIVRPLIVLTAVLGLNYLVWRWFFSVHWSAWWIAVPLVIAESYSLIDSLLFGLTMWRLKKREDPGLPPEGATVDVFITTYNEPLDLVMATARAAQKIRYPHTLWILDDGNRPELREVAGEAGIGVISRSDDWIDMPRHAKAGNLNNALMVTQGEFIVILDADQVPSPDLLDRTLGYFRDERMAIVQTPQFFVNVPESDPLGSQAPLFYGPIQQGKDAWNAAFFCGSNAVLRREALLQMGIRRYVQELELRISDALSTADKVIRRARAGLAGAQPAIDEALADVAQAAQDVRDDLDVGVSIADATGRFQRRVHELSRRLVEADVAMSQADLAELADLTDGDYVDAPANELTPAALDRLARRDWSPLGAIETVRALIAAVDVDREDEAQPIMPMSTISVTEDMATCMRVHSMGWKSAYHDETLATGLAPEDVGTMLTQRLRWAQGTVQVMLRENPMRQKGLTWSQRLMYTATMWTYLSGFAALVYIAAPVIYLVFGILPVHALSIAFFARLVPFMICNQLLFFVIGRGRNTWRGQQYSLALFPVWIKAVTSAVGNVVLGRSLTFAVTPKTRQKIDRRPWHLVRPQLIAMALLVVAAGIGIAHLIAGQATVLGTSINLVWVCFDLALFSVIPRAVCYQGFEPNQPPVEDPIVPSITPLSAPRTDTLQETSR